jgi:hypothetical protein
MINNDDCYEGRRPTSKIRCPAKVIHSSSGQCVMMRMVMILVVVKKVGPGKDE